MRRRCEVHQPPPERIHLAVGRDQADSPLLRLSHVPPGIIPLESNARLGDDPAAHVGWDEAEVQISLSGSGMCWGSPGSDSHCRVRALFFRQLKQWESFWLDYPN